MSPASTGSNPNSQLPSSLTIEPIPLYLSLDGFPRDPSIMPLISFRWKILDGWPRTGVIEVAPFQAAFEEARIVITGGFRECSVGMRWSRSFAGAGGYDALGSKPVWG